MNINEIQNTWNSPRNTMPAERQQQLVCRFTRQRVRRRRFQALWLVNTSVLLLVVTVLAIRTVALGKVNLEQEWALLPLLLIPWVFTVHFIHRFFRPAQPIARGELSVAESLQAAQASIVSEQVNLRRVGALFAIMIPVLGISMQQLYAVGKISPRELGMMATLFAGVLLAGITGVAVRYFGCLSPQRKTVRALLAELAGEGSE